MTPAVRHVRDLTNLQRTRGGMRPLTADEDLSDAARRHSEDMLRRRFFAHVSPDGRTPADRIAAAVRRPVMASAENIWMRSGPVSPAGLTALLDGAFADLMASPIHRRNLMNPRYTHLGVGVAMAETEIRLTQLFVQFGR